jgi:hypothetical protein
VVAMENNEEIIVAGKVAYWHDFDCVDCGLNTKATHEYYMVNDELWLSSGMGFFDGMLCITCLEKRIGRKLNHNDFLKMPINDITYKSNKFSRVLIDRLFRFE